MLVEQSVSHGAANRPGLSGVSISLEHQHGLRLLAHIARSGGHGAHFVQHRFPKPSECKTINSCSGKTFPDAPASPAGPGGSYYPGTLRPGVLHDYHGSLELAPYLSSEQMSMVRPPHTCPAHLDVPVTADGSAHFRSCHISSRHTSA